MNFQLSSTIFAAPMVTAVRVVRNAISGSDEKMSHLMSFPCVYIQLSAALFRTHAVAAVAIFEHILKFAANSVSLKMAAWACIRLGPRLSINIEAHAPTVENKV